MPHLYIIEPLSMVDFSSYSEELSVHLRQGDLDGACSLYAVMTALILLGKVDVFEAKFGSRIDGRTKLGKLLSWWNEGDPLLRAGQELRVVERAVTSFLGKEFSIELNSFCLYEPKFLIHSLASNTPVLLAYTAAHFAHMTCAVGFYETNTSVNILCLDSGYAAPTLCGWNEIISIPKDRRTSATSFASGQKLLNISGIALKKFD